MPTIGMRPVGHTATPCTSTCRIEKFAPRSRKQRTTTRTGRSPVAPTVTASLVLVPVRFQLVVSNTQAVQNYRLTGSGPLFGEWDVRQAPRLTNVATLPDGGTLWAVQFDLLPGRYTYKVGTTCV